jgi:isopenicillin-N epimerase
MDITDSPPPPFGRAMRDAWTLRDDVTFLNHGSFGATPRPVLAAQDDWRQRMEEQPVEFMDRVYPDAIRAAARELGTFVGARGEDIVFVGNATTAINTVLRAATLGPGDEILVLSHAYPTVQKAADHVADRRGAAVVVADIPFPVASASDVVERVKAALSDATRLAVIDHVTSHTATVLPIKELVEACHARGVSVLVDGAHAPGMVEVDFGEIGADWYAANGHKWLCAPKGCGFLWAPGDAQSSLDPIVISLGHGESWTEAFDWTGTHDPSAHLSISAAIDFHYWLGGPAARAANRDLCLAAADLLIERWGTEGGAPAAMTGSMTCVRLPGFADATREDAERVYAQLWQNHGIEVPVLPLSGGLWVRISAHAYNELDDYARLADAVKAL